MLNNKINSQINKKKSFLCIGLDIDINKIPKSLLEYDDPIFEFAKQIIDSTNKYAIAYYICNFFYLWYFKHKTKFFISNL